MLLRASVHVLRLLHSLLAEALKRKGHFSLCSLSWSVGVGAGYRKAGVHLLPRRGPGRWRYIHYRRGLRPARMAQDRPDATHDGDGTHDGVIRTPMGGDVPLRALAYPYGGRGLLHRRGGGSVKEVLFWVVVCFLFLLAVACAIFGAFVRRGEHRYLSW